MAVARNNRHNAAFVVGSILGAVVGAGAALWKTPYTGEELRQKLTGSGSNGNGASSQTVVARPAATSTASSAGGGGIKDKVLSTVEKTLAPIVGVELGKTANGSSGATTPKVVKDPNIQVNTEVASGEQRLRNSHRWQGYDTSETTSTDTNGSLGLSRDKVDADAWAAAYGGAASSSQATQTSQPVASTPTPPAQSAGETGTSSAGTEGGSEYGSTLMGLSRDRVDAKRWAEAYGGTVEESSSSATDTSATTASTSASSDSRSGNVRESSSMSGQGSDPAYPGDDGDAERHAPVDRGTSIGNVAPVSQEGTTRDGREVAADAASVDQLTTPQVAQTPDAVDAGSERSMHPFPKLGGKE